MLSWFKKAIFVFGLLFLAACNAKEITLFQNIDETSANVILKMLPTEGATIKGIKNKNGTYNITFKLGF